MQLALALTLFVATLVLVLVRPRGWHEGLWAGLGALVALATGLTHRRDVLDVLRIAHEPLLFLLALLVFSKLVAQSGFFEWAASHAARSARGSGAVLFRNVFVLGACTTITLSLDTTALLVTPLVLAFVKRLDVPARPYVLACAFVANAASLVLPVSNLTNLLFSSSFGLEFARYATWMALPQLVVLLVTFLLLRRCVAADLGPFDPARAGEPADAIPDRAYFRVTAIVLAVSLVAYFVAPRLRVPTYAVTFVGCVVLAVAARRAGTLEAGFVRDLSWGLFPFVIGLFLVVRALENAGLGALAGRALDHIHGDTARIFAIGGASMLSANVANNLPAALVTRGVGLASPAWAPPEVLAALVGLDVGPNVLPFASLATMLVFQLARDAGSPVPAAEMIRCGVRVTPVAVGAALALLACMRMIA